MGGAWFKPKTHGYGASPASWKGWVAITGIIVVTFAIQWPWFLSPFLAEEEPTIAGLIVTLTLYVVAVLAFIWLCVVKTQGAWAWRWGSRK
jgi:hypothetical protein